MKIILVCIGVFQEYIVHNIKQLYLHKNNDIVVITERNFFSKFQDYKNIQLIDIQDLYSECIQTFENKSTLDRQFRSGFWYNCSLRFFYIYIYMKEYNVNNIIHIENDVMIYQNLDQLSTLFDKTKIYLTFDSLSRVIPGIMFIPDHKTFKQILDRYDVNSNDMVNFGSFINADFVEYLPIIPDIDTRMNVFNKNFKIFNAIFDAAAIGQYIGGIDKRNDPNDTRGFVNETCVVQFDKYEFYWQKNEQDLWEPYIQFNGKTIKIVNLHIHSKMLHNFMSDNPIECKYIRHIYQ